MLTAESLRRTEKAFTQCRAGLAKTRRWGRPLWPLCPENHLPVGAFAPRPSSASKCSIRDQPGAFEVARDRGEDLIQVRDWNCIRALGAPRLVVRNGEEIL